MLNALVRRGRVTQEASLLHSPSDTEVPWNAGICIAGKEIKHIEFWEFR